jgi:hypothetical protein
MNVVVNTPEIPTVTVPSQTVHMNMAKVIGSLYVKLDQLERQVLELQQEVHALRNKNNSVTIDERSN